MDLSTELSEPLADTMAAGARPSFFFMSAKWCGNACASTACSELSSSLAPSAKRNANALFLHVQFQNNPSVHLKSVWVGKGRQTGGHLNSVFLEAKMERNWLT